jgi:hypothetical protein
VPHLNLFSPLHSRTLGSAIVLGVVDAALLRTIEIKR